MRTSINLTERQMADRIAAAIQAEGHELEKNMFSPASFSYDSGDGPYSGSGLSANVSVRNPDGLFASIHLSSAEIQDCIAASLLSEGYGTALESVYLHYEKPTGCPMDPGAGATCSVQITAVPAPGWVKAAIVVRNPRPRRMTVSVNQAQLAERICRALVARGYHIRNKLMTFGCDRDDRSGSKRVRASFAVTMPGGLDGSVELTETDLQERLRDVLSTDGYALAANSISFYYDGPTGSPSDPGNGLTARVQVCAAAKTARK